MTQILHRQENASIPRASTRISDMTLARGIGFGLVGGLAGTVVMDLLLTVTFSAAGLPAFTCFSIVGDTVARFFALLGVEMTGGIPLGIATHYTIGPVIGIFFGVAVARITALRVDSLKKSVLLAALYVEILSQPLLAMTPILLNMTTLGILEWYGVSSVMHLIAGSVLGLVVYYGLYPTAAPGIARPRIG